MWQEGEIAVVQDSAHGGEVRITDPFAQGEPAHGNLFYSEGIKLGVW